MHKLGNKREQALAIARTFREHARETHLTDFAALMSRTADDLEQLAFESEGDAESAMPCDLALH